MTNKIENAIQPQVKRIKHSLSNTIIIKQTITTCVILVFYYSLSILLTFLNHRIFHVSNILNYNIIILYLHRV